MGPESETLPRRTTVLLVVGLVSLLAGGAWLYHQQGQAMRGQVEAELGAIARLKANQIAAWRKERLADAVLLTERPFLGAAVARFLADSRGEDAEALRSRLSSWQKHGRYSNVMLLDPQGQVRLGLSGLVGICPEVAPALATALRERKPVISDLHTGGAYPMPHLSVIAPLFTDGQPPRPIGALVLVINAAQFLFPLVESWPTPSPSAETLLARREGDDVLFLNELRHRRDTALKLRIPLSQTDVPAVQAVLGKQGIVEGQDYRGIAVLSAILPVPDTPWFMVAKVDTAEAFADWRVRSFLALTLLLGLVGGVVGLGLLLWQRQAKRHYRTLYRSEAALRASVERHSVTLKAIGDAVIATDADGRVELLNPVAEALTGWPEEEARGRPLEEIFRIVTEETRATVESPVARVLREGLVIGLANHTLLLARDGREIPIADSGAPIRAADGSISGVVLVFRDQSVERRAQQLTQFRLELIGYAATHSLDELLRHALDGIGALVESPLGFYHVLEADQQTLTLQQWSTRTRTEFCQAEGEGRHYPLDQAGVWVDCVHAKQPVIHNDYAALPHKKGLPAGHAPLLRELVVPVLRAGKVVAILGVGNKPQAYTQTDADTVAVLADITWEIVERKRGEEALARRTAQLQVVRAVSTEITQELDLAVLLELICRRASDLVVGHSGTLWLWDEEAAVLVPAAWHGLGEWAKGQRRALGEGVSGTVAQRRVGMVINEYPTSRFASAVTLAHTRINAIIAEPLLYRDRLLGALSSDRHGPGTSFTEADLDILHLFATQAAIAIENTRLFQQEHDRRRELDAVRVVSTEIARELDQNALLAVITREAVVLAGGERGAVYLWDESQELLVPQPGSGVDATLEAHRFRLGEGVTGTVALRREGMVVNDFRTSPYVTPFHLAHTRHTAVVAEPLLYRDRLVGVISINNGDRARSFTETDRLALALLAPHAAIAIENARLYNDARDALMTAQRAQEELVRAETLRALGQMAAGIAHDLNNTLATILGQAELLKLQSKDPGAQESLGMLTTAAADGAAVIRRLLDFARPRGSSPLVPCDLGPLIREALEFTRPRWKDEAERQGITIKVQVRIAACPPILGYPPEVREALVNLIFNAIDAMPTGGTFTLATRLVPATGDGRRETGDRVTIGPPSPVPGQWIELAMSDTGQGIPLEVQSHLFEPFFTTKGLQGTGLGLSVVYGIMQRQGGTITVTSAPGQGTTFTLRFQVASEPPPPVREAAPRPGRPCRLLLVDDEPLVRGTLASLLRASGHHVTEADDGPAALAALDVQPVDLILTDLGMPNMTGWELSVRVKARAPRLPVLLLTGWGENPDSPSDHPPVDGILGKPVQLEVLLRVIADLTESPPASQ
jgi:PAS domain S-box-containing protein